MCVWGGGVFECTGVIMFMIGGAPGPYSMAAVSVAALLSGLHAYAWRMGTGAAAASSSLQQPEEASMHGQHG